MCCSSAKWKREVVQDHKFDFVDVHEYHTNGFFTRLRYAFVYIFFLKSVLVYISDVYTAIAMLANDYWSGNILQEKDSSDAIAVPFTIGKWIFLGCIIVSFFLLVMETRKARMIIRSRDISYAFTNVMANNYYSMRSYDHFCFFSQIENSKKNKDEFAFFVFFTFKGWKRLLLADAPRQVVNALTLYSFGKAFDFTTDLSKYYNNSDGDFSFVRAGVLCTMIFTVVVWCGSAILLTIAALMYIPLLCYIRGNLKEYCCHKIDKRIAELMKRKTKKRVAREAELAKREAAGDFRHLQDNKGRFKDGQAPLPQPTLPTIDLNDDELYNDGKSEMGGSSRHGGGGGGQGYQQQYAYPPMPTHEQLYGPSGGYGSEVDFRGGGAGAGYAGSEASFAPTGYGQQTHLYSNNGYPMAPHGLPNDSLASLNDDKMSIKSHDPLLTLGGGGLAGSSQISLNRAPSYKTREESDNDGDDIDGLAYARARGSENYPPEKGMSSGQGGYFESDPHNQYSEPPYVQQYQQEEYNYPSNGRYPHHQQQYQHHHSQQQEYENTSYPSSTHSHSRQVSGQQQPSSRIRDQSRGYSIADNRSDVTSYYNNLQDPHGRASIADSAHGAFDLDEYTRQSHYVNQAYENNSGRGVGRASNLDYLPEEEEVDEGIYTRQTGAQNQGHVNSNNGQAQIQQDWRR